MSRILAVDPGAARLGLAVSDPTGTVARPLRVLKHESRTRDAERIVAMARELGAEAIVVGVAYDESGREGPQARRSLRLVEAIRQAGAPVVETWDESGSTQSALELGPDDAMADARAAAIILQGYLDAGAKT